MILDINLELMKKLLFALVTVAVWPLVSCSTPAPEFSPNGPVSDSSDMSWNRPTGPEGGGALGAVLQ